MKARRLLLFFLLIVSHQAFADRAVKGILDLSAQDLSESRVALDGEWEFYWQQLISPASFKTGRQNPDYFPFPRLWNNGTTANGMQLSSQGYATYRLRVILPEERPSLSLAVNHFYSEYRLYQNGVLVAENGVVGTTKESSEPHWIPKTLPILSGSDTLELVIQISNFRHAKGGTRSSVYIGSSEEIVHHSLFEISYDLLLSGCLIMSGLFFFGLFLFGQKENYVFAFALFCLVFSYRFFGADNYALHLLYPAIPWTVTLHFEYLSLFLAPSLFAIYSYALFPKDASFKILGGFAIISGLLGLSTIVLPTTIFTLFVEPYLFFLVATIVYVSYVYFSAARHKREGAKFALLSTMVVFFIFIYKIYIYLTLDQENRLITFIGFIIFFFLQSLNMFFRVTRSLKNAKEEAEEASRTKSDFLSMMSHEIRTPMNAVIGLTNYIIADKPKKEHKEVLNTLKFSAENLLVILNDILDLNKIEANRIEFEKMPVSIVKLTTNLRQVFERLADEKGLYIKVNVDATIDRPIFCDSTRTSQVLSNLISNAIKFTQEGGIELSVNELERTEQHVTLRFAIKDTGIGISISDQRKIFDSFTQASTSVTREYGGTGLGLTITRRLLNLQGVELGLNSEKGKGSEFYFIQKFELADATIETPADIQPIVPTKSKGISILLVEDNKINVLVAQKFLNKWGFRIDLAFNGKEAVEKVLNTKYDLILMDLQMPVLDGYEASKQIRDMGIATPIIALTASTLMEDRDKLKRYGINDHIIKPFEPEELKRKLTLYLSSNIIK